MAVIGRIMCFTYVIACFLDYFYIEKCFSSPFCAVWCSLCLNICGNMSFLLFLFVKALTICCILKLIFIFISARFGSFFSFILGNLTFLGKRRDVVTSPITSKSRVIICDLV